MTDEITSLTVSNIKGEETAPIFRVELIVKICLPEASKPGNYQGDWLHLCKYAPLLPSPIAPYLI